MINQVPIYFFHYTCLQALKQARQTSEYLPQVDIDLGTRDHILTMIMKAEPPPKRRYGFLLFGFASCDLE